MLEYILGILIGLFIIFIILGMVKNDIEFFILSFIIFIAFTFISFGIIYKVEYKNIQNFEYHKFKSQVVLIIDKELYIKTDAYFYNNTNDKTKFHLKINKNIYNNTLGKYLQINKTFIEKENKMLVKYAVVDPDIRVEFEKVNQMSYGYSGVPIFNTLIEAIDCMKDMQMDDINVINYVIEEHKNGNIEIIYEGKFLYQ